ncbi:hypothetical protein [Nostoc sp.]|uniref:hypothetical protein n=1 Tax=Nostoc sp. TaxID=1180 RepID=UPI002FFBCE26
MSQYPIILIPGGIERAKSALPPVPIFTEPLPQKPGTKPQKVNNTLIAVGTAVAIPTIPVVSQLTSIPGWLLLLVAAGAIAGHAWHQITTYPQRKQKHDGEVADYPRKLERYEQEEQEHQEEVKAARSPERVTEFRYKLLLEVLSQTVPHDGSDSPATRNPEEAKFGNHLSRYFPRNIHTRLTLRIPEFRHPYTPDFAYIDQGLKLYIDIELDEPYVYHTGAPTHYLGAWKDNKRNNFFNNKGWVVVRFSEEQVICYPHSCCKTIAQVIAQIIGDTSTLNQFDNIPDLQQQRQWTEQEAVEIAANKKRDNYLCQNNISNSNPVILMTSLIKSKQQVSQPLPPNNITLTRAQSRGAARARHRALNLSISPPTNNTTLSSLVSCPYCSAKVKNTKLELHKTNKCPKRPLL